MPIIKGFKMTNGKMSEGTLKQLKAAATFPFREMTKDEKAKSEIIPADKKESEDAKPGKKPKIRKPASKK